MNPHIHFRNGEQTEEYPVNSIYCVGRNYLKHAQEMQSKLPDAPIIFLKPNSAIVTSETPLVFPKEKGQIHHEVELVVRVCQDGRRIDKRDAWDFVDSYSIGIDFTLRDLQGDLKQKSLPWLLSKGFDHSAAITEFLPIESPESFESIEFFLEKNGRLKQEGVASKMIFDIPTLLAFLSRTITLREGDLIYTGTPAGVGPVRSGDQVTIGIKGQEPVTFNVA